MFSSSPFRLAGEFLLPLPASRIVGVRSSSRGGRWLVPWGAMIGMVYLLTYWAIWSLYGEYMQIRFAASAAVVVADLVFGGRAMVLGLGEVVASGTDRRSGRSIVSAVLAVLIVALVKLTILLVWPRGDTGPWPAGWRTSSMVEPFYPAPVYRPLMLMPMWAAWSAMLAMRVGRTAPTCSPRVAAMADGLGARTLLLQWLILTAATMFYAGADDKHLPIGIIVALAVMLAAYVTAFFLGRRFGGQTESTVLATALAGQITFLLVSLPFVNAIYHY